MNKLQTKIQRNEESFLVTSLGEESVMMNLMNGDFIGLNPVATDIWELIKEPISVEQLIMKLIDKYEVDEAVCTTETMICVDKMMKEKMLFQVSE